MTDCPVCYDECFDMDVLPCGHEFCSSCISKWTNTSLTCPLCRQPIVNHLEITVKCEQTIVSLIRDIQLFDLHEHTTPVELFERINLFYSNNSYIEYGTCFEDIEIMIKLGKQTLVKHIDDFVPYIRNEFFLSSTPIGILNTMDNLILLL